MVIVEILCKALDRDLFATSSKFTDLEISKADLFLDGTSLEQGKASKFSGISTARSLAIIDRSADLTRAAEEIVNSRLAPNDGSPYSPDLIIVNEFVQEEFIRYCAKLAEETEVKRTKPQEKDTSSALQGTVAKAEKTGQVKTTKLSKSGLTIVEIKDR